MREKDEVIPVVEYEIVDAIPVNKYDVPLVRKEDIPDAAVPAPAADMMRKGYFVKGGRGSKKSFQTPEEVETACMEYFSSLQLQALNEKTGQYETYWRVGPTMAGLAMALGISKETLRRYGRSEEFGDVIDWAKEVICEFYETAVQRPGNQSGIIFTMKNYGYSDTRTYTYEPPTRLEAAKSADEIAKLVDEDIV